MRANSTMIVHYESTLAYLRLTESYLSYLWQSRAWRAPTGGNDKPSHVFVSCVRAFPAIIIFQTNDIVFAKIIATLHFNDMGWLVERIGNSVHVTNRYVS